jgi:hypothetical protein
LKEFKKTDMISGAGITIARHNINELEKIAETAIAWGFDKVYFCLPMRKTDSTYVLGSGKKNSVENLTDKQMIKAIEADDKN